MKKILITGSAGFIGRNLLNTLREEYTMYGVDIAGLDSNIAFCDVGNRKAFMQTLQKYQPDIVIHAAAIKSLKDCEKSKVKSWRVNVGSTNTIVRYCKDANAKCIYISSDVVFDGYKGGYHEGDIPNPINWYGVTKLHSELLVRQTKNFAICRTALVIGDISPDMIKQLKLEVSNSILDNQSLFPYYVYNRLYRHQDVRLPSNIVSSPTSIRMLCIAMQKLIEKDYSGIFHFTGPEAISRYDFALRVAKFKNCDEALIVEDNRNVLKIRPRNVSLNVDNTYQILGLNKQEWNIDSLLRKLDWITV